MRAYISVMPTPPITGYCQGIAGAALALSPITSCPLVPAPYPLPLPVVMQISPNTSTSATRDQRRFALPWQRSRRRRTTRRATGRSWA